MPVGQMHPCETPDKELNLFQVWWNILHSHLKIFCFTTATLISLFFWIVWSGPSNIHHIKVFGGYWADRLLCGWCDWCDLAQVTSQVVRLWGWRCRETTSFPVAGTQTLVVKTFSSQARAQKCNKKQPKCNILTSRTAFNVVDIISLREVSLAV